MKKGGFVNLIFHSHRLITMSSIGKKILPLRLV